MVAWMVALISRRHLMLVVGHNGNAHAKSANNDTKKHGFGPSNAVA